MDRQTFDAAIRTPRDRTPFKPFTVALVNGRSVEIDRPGAILVRAGTALFAGPGGIPHVFDLEGVARIIGDLAGQS